MSRAIKWAMQGVKCTQRDRPSGRKGEKMEETQVLAVLKAIAFKGDLAK